MLKHKIAPEVALKYTMNCTLSTCSLEKDIWIPSF